MINQVYQRRGCDSIPPLKVHTVTQDFIVCSPVCGQFTMINYHIEKSRFEIDYVRIKYE